MRITDFEDYNDLEKYPTQINVRIADGRYGDYAVTDEAEIKEIICLSWRAAHITVCG